MKVFRFSPRAAADIDKIWDYTAEQWSVDQAELYTDELRDACLAIAQQIRVGSRTSIRSDTYKLRCSAHIIYYRTTPNCIEIIRILHGKQDVERHL